MNPNRRRALLALGALALAGAAAAAGWLAKPSREIDADDLTAVQAALASAKDRHGRLRAELIASSLNLLAGAVLARDPAALESARKGLVQIGPDVVPAARELALRTKADPLRRELVAVLGELKDPAAAEALADVYLSVPAQHRAVRDGAALALARRADRPGAAALGRLVRAERSADERARLAPLYAPLAAMDPEGVAPDPAVRTRIEAAARESRLAAEIQKLDPTADADFARLRSLAAGDEPAAHRAAAVRRLATRPGSAGVLVDLVRAPGPDPDGIVRNAALSQLFRSADPEAAAAVRGFLTANDAALRRAALAAAQSAAGPSHRADLALVRDGDYPEEHRTLAARALDRVDQRATK
jgi:hypothetical protein